ncbi:MAG TPA: aspartate aminotransferase family protein [Verrucomicrobiae bacterium]
MPTKTQIVLRTLQTYESRNILFTEPDGSWPIVWERAQGNYVWDIEGRKYLDLTAAFGVAAAGHANPRVVKAGQKQMGKLLHAMGDVHPHPLKAALAQKLSDITFGRWKKSAQGKTIFCNSGFEAVETALKTAHLATGKPGIIAFQGAYHGVGYGALNATHRKHFHGPFRKQLKSFGHFVSFPKTYDDLKSIEQQIRALFKKQKIGALLLEPMQARGGINLPPESFLKLLRRLCDEHQALLILDEIYTGFGRTGQWFACEHSGVMPDLICLGKALTGGFPLSACVGSAAVMDKAWPPSNGEAIHTSTFLGHPVGCAMALAQIDELQKKKLPERSRKLGLVLEKLLKTLKPPTGLKFEVRVSGLMAGLEIRTQDNQPATHTVLKTINRLLQRGFILLPEGEFADVISLTPPLTITEAGLRRTVKALGECLTEVTK